MARQVARYSALTFGVLYGIVHRQTLQTKLDHHNAEAEIHKREQWLQQAKEAWAAKQAKQGGGTHKPTACRFPLLFDAKADRVSNRSDCSHHGPGRAWV